MTSVSVLVPVSGRARHLDATVASLRAQTHPAWELVAVLTPDAPAVARDELSAAAGADPRVSVYETAAGGNAATGNEALTRSHSGWVAFIEPGDELHRHAVARITEAAGAATVDFVYTDEDRLDDTGAHSDPFYKPAWSPDRLRAQHYTGGLSAFRHELVDRLGGLRGEVEGAHLHDLALRVGEEARDVTHLDGVLFHRRGTVGDDAHAGTRAVTDHIARAGIPADVAPHPHGHGLYQLRPRLAAEPLVSIVIPTACQSRRVRGDVMMLAANCVRSILERSTYPNYEIIAVVDEHVDDDRRAELSHAGGNRTELVPFSGRFDFSRKINTGVLASRGDFVVLLNDDTEVITPEWIEQLLMYAQQDGVGAVGARLNFADGRIQHAGIAAIYGRAGHSYYGFPGDHPGYFDNALIPLDQVAVTAACLMTPRAAFDEVGGLSLDFPLNYNDVDYCLKLRRAGYRSVCNPDARLWHLEGATRVTGTVDKFELDMLHARWGHILNHDPYYSPYFPPWSADYITPVYRSDGTPMPPPEPMGLYWLRNALKPG